MQAPLSAKAMHAPQESSAHERLSRSPSMSPPHSSLLFRSLAREFAPGFIDHWRAPPAPPTRCGVAIQRRPLAPATGAFGATDTSEVNMTESAERDNHTCNPSAPQGLFAIWDGSPHLPVCKVRPTGNEGDAQGPQLPSCVWGQANRHGAATANAASRHGDDMRPQQPSNGSSIAVFNSRSTASMSSTRFRFLHMGISAAHLPQQ